MAIPEGYKALAKIGISYKGDYVSETSYNQLDAVAYSGSTYLALINNPVGIPADDGVNWKYLAKGFPSDINDVELTFTEATIRENIESGEKNKTIMGKVRKWFTDLTAAAFSQMITSYPDLMANTVQGYLADAQAVKEGFNEINSNLSTKKIEFIGHTNSTTGLTVNYDISEYDSILVCIGKNNMTFASTLVPLYNIETFGFTHAGVSSSYSGSNYEGYAIIDGTKITVMMVSNNSVILSIYGIKH